MDADKQYPVHIGTIAKAGDAQDGETVGGKESLKPGTNSTPPGGRIANNAFITRQGKNIKTDDNSTSSYDQSSVLTTPQEQNDSDGVDITNNAIQKTKFGNFPTIGSLIQPAENVLLQLQNVDPQNLNAVLKNAIPSFIKMEDLNTFSSAGGVTNVLGQALGQAFNQIGQKIGQASLLNTIGQAISDPSQVSSLTAQALFTAITTMGSDQNLSDVVASVIGQSLPVLVAQILALIETGGLTITALNNLLAAFFSQIQDNGSQATLGQGITLGNILNVLSQVLPTLASPIQNTLDIHLPISFLNESIVSTAIQKFSMNQAFLKAPNNGKKALAIQATEPTPDQQNSTLAGVASSVEGVGSSTVNAFKNLF